jgi:hypothetical protein
MTTGQRPPMDPTTDEATARQLELAREQGESYVRALRHMTDDVPHDGGSRTVGEYLIGYAVEEAEGLYEWSDGELTWREPEDENLHLGVAVCDAADGRFIPDVRVTATLIAPDGQEVGTHEMPILWHPMIYHYGRNWTVPADGDYTLVVRVEPPRFMRHDDVNGRRFTEPVEVEFTGVSVKRGQD